VSDEALRRIERELATLPAELDLRRQHAQVLLRMGRADEGLAALDLAWRLGAEELWDELQARLAERAIEVDESLTLRYVPAGPFAMGSDELDADCAPVHLVELSAFYVAERPLCRGSLLEWEQCPEYLRRFGGGHESEIAHYGMFASGGFFPQSDHAAAQSAVEFLSQTKTPPGLMGRYSVISEAQWERVFRAEYLRPDGANPYGVRRAGARTPPEWTLDRYDADYYDTSPRRDPPGSDKGKLFVVRGVRLPDPVFAIYREAAKPDGRFQLGGRIMGRDVSNEEGIAMRPVFLPLAPHEAQ
jgi:formylglycine-generating enzyme required for sulfatase activity